MGIFGPFFINYEEKFGHKVVIWYGFHEFPVTMVAWLNIIHILPRIHGFYLVNITQKPQKWAKCSEYGSFSRKWAVLTPKMNFPGKCKTVSLFYSWKYIKNVLNEKNLSRGSKRQKEMRIVGIFLYCAAHPRFSFFFEIL